MQIFNLYRNDLLPLSQEPYFERGILPTEAFAFISYCKALNVDMVIESGTAYGQSCYLYAKYLNIPVHTIDNISHYGDNAQNTAKERCKNLDVTFHIGDSNYLLPQLLQQYKDKKIAVFIDGPKGQAAQDLRSKIWNGNDNVVIAALHDSIGDNAIGRFSSANHPNFLNEYRELFDVDSLNQPYPDDPSITLRERFKTGMGMDLWYKPRNIIYYVYTGGVDFLYKDFIESAKRHCNPTFMCLTNEDVDVVADYRTTFTDEEQGGTMGPKINALRRLPLVNGDNVFIMDIDTYCNDDIFKVFNTVQEIGVTTRNKRDSEAAIYSPINAGVWCFKHSPDMELLFDWFYEQLTNPTYDRWIEYKRNHPHSQAIGLREWWVDQDLLNVLYANQKEFNIEVKDIGAEYNWIVTDDEFATSKDNNYKILHRKGGTGKRWNKTY
jgi:hypothetical protein